MAVTGIDFTPGVDDGDHRLAQIVIQRMAQLRHARAMVEGAHAFLAEPAPGSQGLGLDTMVWLPAAGLR